MQPRGFLGADDVTAGAPAQLVHHGRTGLLCRRLELDIADGSAGETSQRYPVLVRPLYVHARMLLLHQLCDFKSQLLHDQQGISILQTACDR